MEQRTQSVELQERPTLYLIELSVYLFNPETSPTLINPDFLRFNEIVEPSWRVVRPVIVERDYCRIRYDNGLSITAHDDHIEITQRAVAEQQDSTPVTPLTADNILCVGMATRYLDLVNPDSPYGILSIDPQGWMEVPEVKLPFLSSPLIEFATQVSFGGRTPVVEARASYTLPDKRVVMYISEDLPQDSGDTFRLRFSGEFIHSINGETAREQVPVITNLLDNWEQDIRDFDDLAHQFYLSYIRREK